MLMWSVGNMEIPPPKAWVVKLLVATQVQGAAACMCCVCSSVALGSCACCTSGRIKNRRVLILCKQKHAWSRRCVQLYYT
jgi:hypothetical protein